MSVGPADKALDVFKDLIFDQMVKSAISYIIGLEPLLAWVPVSFLIGKVVTYVAGIIYEEMKDAINFQVILLNNRSHHEGYINALSILKRIANEKGIDSEEFKTQREIHKATLSRFIRYSGS